MSFSETSSTPDDLAPPDAVSRTRVRFFAACAVGDRESVAAVVATLRLSSTPVLMDRDFAGSPRKAGAAICGAIAATPRFLLFWSSATAADVHAQRQLALALAAGRVILTVKLDDTPLPPGLADGCPSLDFTDLVVESLEEQDDLLGEYTLSEETREFWYRVRGEESTFGPAPEFFEAWVHLAFVLAGGFLAFGVSRNPASAAWVSVAVGLAVGIVFGPLLAHAMARHRARREMDRWLASTVRLYGDPTAARLRAGDDFQSLSPLEAAALLHEMLSRS